MAPCHQLFPKVTNKANRTSQKNITLGIFEFSSHSCGHLLVLSTCSSAGILYINPADLGWNPPVASWIDRREVQSEKANLTILFDKYLPSCLDTLRTR